VVLRPETGCSANINLGQFWGMTTRPNEADRKLIVYSTWRGERGEEWSSAQGLESILISIQSLMSSNPYENEPGFEHANDEGDKKNQKDYVAKVRKAYVLGVSSLTRPRRSAMNLSEYL